MPAFRTLILLLCVWLALIGQAADSAALRKLLARTRDWPVNLLARRCYLNLEAGRSDSAELYAVAAMMRYREDMSYRDKVNSVVGMINLGYLYAFQGHNGEEAFRVLLRAKDISERHRLHVLPAVYDNIAKIYDDFGDTSSAINYYRKAFELARKNRDSLLELMAFNDLCALALNRDMLDSIRPQMRAIAAESFSDSVSMGRYSMELSRGLSMLLDHDPGASDVLRQASPLIDSKVDTERYKATHNLYLAAALMAEGRLDEARTRLRESEMTALANSLSDMLPHIYGGFARLETLAGDREAASRATMRMLSVRDSLYNARSFGRIKDMESSATIEGLTNSLTEAETSSNHRNAVILILSFSILLVLSLVWMLIRRNRSLKASYEALARKNSELAEMARPARITQSSGMIPLSGEEQRQLASDIINLLEKDPRIFSPDFSADELAAILDSKVKYVSAVINSSFGKNFSALLADYRIREACRLLKDPESSASLSLEGVAERVGYRSRSHFSSVFKKVTGLTPAKYASLSKESD